MFHLQDEILRRAVADHGGKNWKAIAEHFDGARSDVQCLHRWQKVLNPDLVKGPWTLAVRMPRLPCSSFCSCSVVLSRMRTNASTALKL